MEVAEPGDGGGVEPGSVGFDWGGGAASPEGGVGVVPEAGGDEGEDEEAVTLTLSFWPLLQWPWTVHAK